MFTHRDNVIWIGPYPNQTPKLDPENTYHVAYIKLFRLIPLHTFDYAVVVSGDYEIRRWWDGFRSYKRWVQILILLGIIKLEIREIKRSELR